MITEGRMTATDELRRITDELRAWAHGPDEGDDWLDRIDEFCDRIDSAYERGGGSKEMNITEELRMMLDNRGVKWDEIVDHENMMIGTRWKDSRGYFVTAFAYADCPHIKTFTDFFWQPTPKEAVEATLGIEVDS